MRLDDPRTLPSTPHLPPATPHLAPPTPHLPPSTHHHLTSSSLLPPTSSLLPPTTSLLNQQTQLTTSITTQILQQHHQPPLVAPTPTLPHAPAPVTYQEFFLDTPPQAFSTYPHHIQYSSPQPAAAAAAYPPTYQPTVASALTPQLSLNTPTAAGYYTPAAGDLDLKRHAARSPVSGKFVRQNGGGGGAAKPRAERKERRQPAKKVKEEAEEPEYDPEVIANAHLTMVDEHYVCSVCSMKFKQPGNARRHIITVHRNEKPHVCMKCDARFGRKVSKIFHYFFFFSLLSFNFVDMSRIGSV